MASEIARLRREIALQYEAAMYGMHGLAYGTAQHKLITNRVQRMGVCADKLAEVVGKKEAGELMAETLEAFPDEANMLPC